MSVTSVIMCVRHIPPDGHPPSLILSGDGQNIECGANQRRWSCAFMSVTIHKMLCILFAVSLVLSSVGNVVSC